MATRARGKWLNRRAFRENESNSRPELSMQDGISASQPAFAHPSFAAVKSTPVPRRPPRGHRRQHRQHHEIGDDGASANEEAQPLGRRKARQQKQREARGDDDH